MACTINLGPSTQGTVCAFYLLPFILNGLDFSGHRRSMQYHFIPWIWILYRSSSFPSMQHILLILSFVPRTWRYPVGRDRASLGYQTLTVHPTTANYETPNHSTTLGEAKHHRAWISGNKGSEVPGGTPNDNNHNLKKKLHDMWSPRPGSKKWCVLLCVRQDSCIIIHILW